MKVYLAETQMSKKEDNVGQVTTTRENVKK